MKLNWQVAALAIIVMKIRNGSLRLQHLEQNAHGMAYIYVVILIVKVQRALP